LKTVEDSQIHSRWKKVQAAFQEESQTFAELGSELESFDGLRARWLKDNAAAPSDITNSSRIDIPSGNPAALKKAPPTRGKILFPACKSHPHVAC
jgi:hypothetical protein